MINILTTQRKLIEEKIKIMKQKTIKNTCTEGPRVARDRKNRKRGCRGEENKGLDLQAEGDVDNRAWWEREHWVWTEGKEEHSGPGWR